jgi:hypothetical protein
MGRGNPVAAPLHQGSFKRRVRDIKGIQCSMVTLRTVREGHVIRRHAAYFTWFPEVVREPCRFPVIPLNHAPHSVPDNPFRIVVRYVVKVASYYWVDVSMVLEPL